MRGIHKEITRLAVPSILANITVPLVGMVDIAIAGHLDNALFNTATLIGGVTIGSMMFDLLYWNFGFLRAGTGGMTAQAYGREDRNDISSTLCKGVGLALIIALTIIVLQYPFAKIISLFVKATPEVLSLAFQYFFIRIWASPATLSLMAIRGWFIGMQDSFSAMLCDLTVNISNIALSILLSFGLANLGIAGNSATMGIESTNFLFNGLGFKGIALGTVLAQYTGLILALCIILTKYRSYFTDLKSIAILKASELKKFMTMNADLFIRSLCLIIIYIGFTTISAGYGDSLLATASIMMKLLMLFSYFTDGFAFAGEALTGKYIGRNDKEMLKASIHNVFLWSMSISALFMFIYFFASVPILKIMTSDQSIIESSKQYFLWLYLMPPVGCAAFTFDGIFIGATASKAMRDSSIAAVIAFFTFWLCLKPFSANSEMAIHFLLAAYFAHLAARTIWLWGSYKKVILR